MIINKSLFERFSLLFSGKVVVIIYVIYSIFINQRCINISMSVPSTKEHKDLKKKKKLVLVKWVKPPLGWFKLNTDGSSNQHRVLARGGVIRDAFGNWVVGFSSVIDFTTSVMVEQSVLRDGLVMAKNLGIAKIVVELDAFVNLVTISSKAKKLMKNIVMECKNLLHDFEKYIVHHAYKIGNRVVDVQFGESSG